MKIFKFEHSEGAEIIVADNAKDVINFYIHGAVNSLILEDIVELGGIKIEELQGEDINKKYEIFNDKQGILEKVSYKELALAFFNGQPKVIVALQH